MSKSIVCVLWALSMALAAAQQPAPLTPKTDQKPLPQTPATAQQIEPAFTEQLKGIVIVGAESEIKRIGPIQDVSGVRVDAPPFLVARKEELARELAPFLGQRLTRTTLKLIQTNLIRFARQYESRILDIVYVAQESVKLGILQLAVVEARTVIDPERDRVPELRGVVVINNPAEVKPRGGVGPVTGVKIVGAGNPLAGQEPALTVALKDFLGQPFSAGRIDELRATIHGFIEKMEDAPKVASVIVPEQQIIKDEWVVQVLVSIGEIGRLNIEGEKWFSDSEIRSLLRIRQGDPVIVDRLVDDINWINRNMFREADVMLRQGTEIGQVDVNVRVEDRFPFQVFAGAEDTLPETLDDYMWFVGFNWGKAFGLDHLLNYQFAAGFDFDAIKSHSASYVAPLPWRHILTLGGAYAEFKPDLANVGPLLTSDGTSYQFNGTYTVPLPRVRSYFHEMSAGFDYKYTDNNLLFGGGPLVQPTEIAQIVAGYEGLSLDGWGRSRFQLRGVYSPGDLFGHNKDEDFDLTHQNADAGYYFFRLAGERVTKLPFLHNWRKRDVAQCFSIALSAAAQLSEERLLPSEQIVFGGYDSVRGYDEFSILADEGWKARAELRSPEFTFGPSAKAAEGATPALGPDPKRAARIQPFGFFDYGEARNFLQSNNEFDDFPGGDTLMSVGAGLRGGWSRHLEFRFDWGFPIGDELAGQDDHRTHFSVIAKF